MRVKIALLLSAFLLTGAIAATAQPLSCASVAPEVREHVREAGACRSVTSGDIALKGAAPTSSSAVTMTLSDGTVVRIPRDISSNINDGRKRAASSEKAPQPKRAARARPSAQSPPDASRDSAPAPQFNVPDVIGRNYADAAGVLAEFKIDRIETASAAPSGEVIAQEPAPATLMLPGSTVSLQVSDGSLASAADIAPVAETNTAAAPAPAPAPPAAPTSASDPTQTPSTSASDPTQTPAPRELFSIAFSLDAVLILGVGVLLGLLLGSLLMHQLLRRKLSGARTAAASTPSPHQTVETVGVGVASETEAPEIRFAARLVPVETTIAFSPVPDAEELATEHWSDHYA